MSGNILIAGCCCDECTEDCTDCATNCNSSGDIAYSVDYTPCGDAVDCAGLSGGSGTLAKGFVPEDCRWFTDENGALAGDFDGDIRCEDLGGGVKKWMLDVWVVTAELACRSWDNVVCVHCISGRPTGVFVVPMYDEGKAAACGTATVTLSIP